MKIGDKVYFVERRSRHHSYGTYFNAIAGRVVSFDDGLVCLTSDGKTYFRQPRYVYSSEPKKKDLERWDDEWIQVDANERDVAAGTGEKP